jgi:hypothetical protein
MLSITARPAQPLKPPPTQIGNILNGQDRPFLSLATMGRKAQSPDHLTAAMATSAGAKIQTDMKTEQLAELSPTARLDDELKRGLDFRELAA